MIHCQFVLQELEEIPEEVKVPFIRYDPDHSLMVYRCNVCLTYIKHLRLLFPSDHLLKRGVTDIALKLCALRQAFTVSITFVYLLLLRR